MMMDRLLTRHHSLWLDGLMSNATIINGHIIVTPQVAKEMGFEIPAFAKGFDLLAYDRDNDLVAWGPESERDHMVKILRVFS